MRFSTQAFLLLIVGVFLSGALLMLMPQTPAGLDSSFGHALVSLQYPGMYVGMVLWGVHSATQLQINATMIIVNGLIYAAVLLMVFRVLFRSKSEL